MRFYEVSLEPLAIRLFKYWVHGVTWTLDKLKIIKIQISVTGRA